VKKEIIRYAFSTGLSASVTLGVPVVLHELFGIEQRVAVAISQCTALFVNFLMIRNFVFRSSRPATRDLTFYLGSAATFRGSEYLLFLALFSLARLFYFTALLITLGTSTVLKFIWYRFLFGQRPEPVV
jgi:putative flippase GtrA